MALFAYTSEKIVKRDESARGNTPIGNRPKASTRQNTARSLSSTGRVVSSGRLLHHATSNLDNHVLREPAWKRLTRWACPFGQRDGLVFCIPVKYQVPRQVVMHCLDAVNVLDCPQWPGLIRINTFQRLLRGFDKVLGNWACDERRAQIQDVMQHLRVHTLRRRGEKIWNDGYVEWEQTSRVFELFCAKLNVFERIFFTVDVSENRAVLSQMCSTFLMTLIVLSNVVWALSTLPTFNEAPTGCTGTNVGDCEPRPTIFFHVFEIVSVYIFTAEYAVRLLTVHSVRFQLLDESFLHELIVSSSGDYKDEDEEEEAHDLIREFSDADERQSPAEASSTASAICSPSSSVSVFSAEMASSACNLGTLQGRMHSRLYTLARYVIQPSSIIDLLAIIPYWVGIISGADGGGGLVIMRALRLTRIFRVFKMGSVNDAFQIFSRVIRLSMPALGIMVCFVSMLCCFFGTLIWFLEEGAWYPQGNPKLATLGIVGRGAYLRRDGNVKCPECLEESPFPSILHTFWFIVVTVTTVGYGIPDVPTTNAGKMVSAFAMLIGVIVLAMPIGVIGTNFSHEYQEMVSERDRREKAKLAMLHLAEMEKEQDAAVRSQADKLFFGSHSSASTEILEKSNGVELEKVHKARMSVLSKSETLAAKWKESLPPVLHEPVCRRLRHVASQFLNDDALSHSSLASHQKPVIFLSYLADLDELTEQAHYFITSSVSTEPDADFGFMRARDLRRLWDEFVDACWLYAVDVCEVEEEGEPPEYWALKAAVRHARADPSRSVDTNGSTKRSSEQLWQRASLRTSALHRMRRRTQRAPSTRGNARTSSLSRVDGDWSRAN